MLGFQQLGPPKGTPVTPQTAFMEVSETPSHILSDDQGSTSLCSWEELSSSAPPPIPLLFYTSRGCFPPLSSFLLLCPAWPQFCFPSYALVAKSSSLRWNCFSPGLVLYHSLPASQLTKVHPVLCNGTYPSRPSTDAVCELFADSITSPSGRRAKTF